MKHPINIDNRIDLLRGIAQNEELRGETIIAEDLRGAADLIEGLRDALLVVHNDTKARFGMYLGVPVSTVVERSLRGIAPEKPTK